MPSRSESGALPRRQVIDGQHGVRLAAAERGLQLDDRLAALAAQPLGDLREQQPHAFGDEGPLEERGRVLVLGSRLAGADGGDVGRELRLLECALQARPGGGQRFLARVSYVDSPNRVAVTCHRQPRGGFDAAPAGDQFVVGAGVLGLPDAFAERVEPIGKLADRLGFAADAGEQSTGSAESPPLPEGADQLMQRFPDRQCACRVRGSQSAGYSVHLSRRTLPPPTSNHAGLLHAVHARPLGAGERVGLAELAFVPAVLLEPVQAELRVGVEVVLGEEAVDELQGGPHGHRRAVGFKHGGVLGEDRHAGADDRLRQVHRRDGRMLAARTFGHLVECLGQHAVQLAHETRGGKWLAHLQRRLRQTRMMLEARAFVAIADACAASFSFASAMFQ